MDFMHFFSPTAILGLLQCQSQQSLSGWRDFGISPSGQPLLLYTLGGCGGVTGRARGRSYISAPHLAFMKGFQHRHHDTGHYIWHLRCCAWSAALQSRAVSRRHFPSLQKELTSVRSLPAVGVTSLSGCHHYEFKRPD